MDFVHLHVHSHYSLLDGLGKIDELIARAKELGMPAIALTDHGNMYGAIEFYTKCKKAGIKPILGVEAYLAPRGRLDKVPKIDSKAYHQLLLAKNEAGYKNLLLLVSEAYTTGMYYKPRIDLDLLAAHAKGLIATSSCLAGIIPEAIARGDVAAAYVLAKRFVDLFDGDFFLELQHHPTLKEQGVVNSTLKQIGHELNIGLIATSDVHYIRPEDKETHEILLAVNTGRDLAADDRMTFGDVDVSMHNTGFMAANFADTPEALLNTRKIADSVELKLNLGDTILPDFPLPGGFDDSMAYLRHLALAGANERFGQLAPAIRQRLEMELSVIAQTGFASYFLIVADFVTWAKDRGILVGPGRGSAASSIVTYCLRISDINPLAYDPPLPFERFLNPDRVEMPDIDLDFADTRRDEVIAYVRQKYGADHVAGIATFGTMMGRAAVRDVGRVMGLPYATVDAIAKLVPVPIQGRHIPLKTSLAKVAELRTRAESDPTIARLLDFAAKLEGTVRHASQHASAFVITKEPLVHYAPVQPATKGGIGLITQYAMKPIADIGLLKMDFLGLSNLTVIQNALRIIRKIDGVAIDIGAIPLDDKKTFALLTRGDTTGLFQLESEGMKRYIKELKPDRFADIVAMVSLYRPGPMQSIPSYIARKHDREPIVYDHPLLKNSLAETYGVIVYQEQVMQAAKDLAGFSGGQADTLRKAMGKKIARLMAEMKPKFYAGCVSRGIDQKTAEAIFAKFETFSAYGFNKAHATCYATIAYQTAYLKANYPAAFMAALLTSDAQNLDRIGIEINEAERLELAVLPPDVNESFPEFGVIRKDPGSDFRDRATLSPESTKAASEYIRFGLAAIKNVGYGVAERIVKERQANGPYANLTDFLHRLGPAVLNKRVLEPLAMTGALDGFGERGALVESIETMTRFLGQGKKDASQLGLFGPETAIISQIALADVPPVKARQALEWEKELLGIYLSSHPLKAVAGLLAKLTTPLSDISPAAAGRSVRVGGLVGEVRVITTKSNEPMAFAKISDATGVIEAVAFPRVWTDAQSACQSDRYVIADGRVDIRDGEVKLIVSRLMELSPDADAAVVVASLGPTPQTLPGRPTPPPVTDSALDRLRPKSADAAADPRLVLRLPPAASKRSLERIRAILTEFSGEIPVYIETDHGSGAQAKTKSRVNGATAIIGALAAANVTAVFEGHPSNSNAPVRVAPPETDEPVAVNPV